MNIKLSNLNKISSSLAWQVALPSLFLSIIFCAIGLYFIYTIIDDHLLQQQEQRAKLAVNAIQSFVESADDITTIQGYLRAMIAEEEFDSITIVAKKKNKVIASTNAEWLNLNFLSINGISSKSLLSDSLNNKTTHAGFSDSSYSKFYYSKGISFSNILEDNYPLGQGAVLITMQTNTFLGSRISILQAVGIFMLVLFFSSAIVNIYLIHFLILRPQKRMLDFIRRRQAGEKVFLPVKGKNELAILSQAFNNLLTTNDQVDRLKGEFISSVSHELRTPLTSIKGSLSLVVGLHEKDLNDQSKSLINIAQSNTDRLTALINDILDFEKITSGVLKMEMLPLDLVTVTKNALMSNKGYAQHYNIELVFSIYPRNAYILGDELRLQQVFSNILSNAIKFSPVQAVVVISLHLHSNFYRVCIRDVGPGIPPEFRNRIFQRFSQVDSSTTRAKGGTGLGLSITKAIIEQHHGKIDYWSVEGMGTEFYFDLPIDTTRNNANLFSVTTNNETTPNGTT